MLDYVEAEDYAIEGSTITSIEYTCLSECETACDNTTDCIGYVDHFESDPVKCNLKSSLVGLHVSSLNGTLKNLWTKDVLPPMPPPISPSTPPPAPPPPPVSPSFLSVPLKKAAASGLSAGKQAQLDAVLQRVRSSQLAGMAGVEAVLDCLALSQYRDAFEEEGYDDVEHMVYGMSEEDREAMCDDTKMKPGHKGKLCTMLQRAKDA